MRGVRPIQAIFDLFLHCMYGPIGGGGSEATFHCFTCVDVKISVKMTGS